MEPPAKVERLTRSLQAAPCLAVNGGVFVFFVAIVAGAFVSSYWISASARVAPIIPIAVPAIAQNAATSPLRAPGLTTPFTSSQDAANRTPSELPAGLTQQPSPAPASEAATESSSATTTGSCPAYFRWIHEDLRPWRATGITRETLEGAHRYMPKFRVTVVAGRLYVRRYGRCFQTRDVFTQWGILQLLRRYNTTGRRAVVPDLDLMFDCQDLPVVDAGNHRGCHPPPLFRYCGSEPTLDIAFPDWSFWGRSLT